ncbi:uncharacterized protein N7483_009172 [Penicillium malachiteum]|uniref:uncharacterized protein n=1 Tax=Penicillium malachiteum TaxID=1324776 RepID=UPI0025481D4C|nr:uncharacterized protein N7483_009172 [Penicillium malachiteum]KAJ5721238.1 hypothetical protein N7483_009172 [Penicillium malachiteum]
MSPYPATAQYPPPYLAPYVSWAHQYCYSFIHFNRDMTRRDSGGWQHLTAKNSSRSSLPLRIPGRQGLDNSSFNEAGLPRNIYISRLIMDNNTSPLQLELHPRYDPIFGG